MNTANNTGFPSQKTSESRNMFATDFVWVAAAQLFTNLVLGIVALPLLTKHYSPEIYGIWVQIIITVTFLYPFFTMQLDMAAVRFLSGEEDESKRRNAISSMLFAIISFSILVFAVVNFAASSLSEILFASPEYTSYVRLTFLWVIFDALFVFFGAYFRSQKKLKLLSIRQIAYSGGMMAIIIGLSSTGLELEWVVGSVLALESAFALVFFIMIVREIGWPAATLSGLKGYLAFSLPQIPGTALLWLIASSDRYFITHLLSLSDSGIYSSSSQLAGLTRLFYAPICFVLYPTLSRLWDRNRITEVRNYLQNATRLLLTLGIPASVGLALISQPLLEMLTTSEFLAGQDLVLFISIGTILLGIFQINSQVILLAKKTRLLPLMISASAIISVTVNIMLIPRIGITGAAISNIASYSLLAAIVTVMAMRTTRYFIDLKFIAKIIGATIPMAACLYFLKINDIWGIVTGIVTGSIVFGGGIFLLRAFSPSDKQLIRVAFDSLVPGYIRKGHKVQ